MSNKFQVTLSESAIKEFANLDGSIKKLVAKQFKALEENPFKGELLGSRAGFDLSSCYKLYVHKKQLRIVYQVINNELVIFVIGIVKRENLEIYKEVFKRLSE